MTGLERVRRVGPIGPVPSSGMGRRSPSATALRSAPAQKVPPAPVSTATEASGVGVEGQERLSELVGAHAVDRVAALGPVDGDDGDRAVVLEHRGCRCG